MNPRVIFSATAAFLVVSTAVTVPICVAAKEKDSGLTALEQLGKEIFFDKISDPDWMSCSTCHSPDSGWTGPIPGINKHGAVYRGAVPQRFGNRKPPSAGYATLSPIFDYDGTEEIFIGGNFWDGRATGEDLGNPAADQARGPFLNPVEQHNYDREAVCNQVADAKYADLYEEAYGEPINCEGEEDLEESYNNIASAIAAYEGSSEVNQFSSKYDAYRAGKAELTEEEEWGLELFNDAEKGNCAACHPSEPGPYHDKPLFADFTYDNLGVPKNPDNPFYGMDEVYNDDGNPVNPDGSDWVDPGLAGFLETRSEWADMADGNHGKHKVPTLRNVAQAQGKGEQKAYMHNGVFKSLEEVVHFYNTRDVEEEEWPEPEVGETVNEEELGNLELTSAEEAAIVAFLKTLSDGYFEPDNGN